MIYTSENNWYSWNYDGAPFARQTGEQKFSTTFSPPAGKYGSFKEELLKAAASTLDLYPDLKPSILFSGGLDSEIMLRSYLEIGSKPDVYIFRYENDCNIYDVSYAVTICSILNVDYKIIDFNLQKFYENEAERYSDLAQIDRPRALPYCKFLEITDGFPILGSSDLTVARLSTDYSVKGNWIVRCWEHDIGWSKFVREIDKPAVAEWFKWTPGLVASFLQLSWLKDLVNDRIYGKLGTTSTKIRGYREAYPDLIFREKKTGFENLSADVVKEFEEFLEKKNNGLKYRNGFDRSVVDLARLFNLTV